MNNDELSTPIIIMNRQTGEVDMIVKTKKQYIKVYAQIVEMNDVSTAIKVWCDFTGQTKKELLRDFSLKELINTFSTRYMAQLTRKVNK